MCRRTWLLGIHIEASRFRRKANDLKKRLNDTPNDRLKSPHTNVTSGSAFSSSRLISGPSHSPSVHQWKRPATSMDVRKTDPSEYLPSHSPSVHRWKRPATSMDVRKIDPSEYLPQARRPRPRKTVVPKAGVREKPLFKVRDGNTVVNTSSSDEDNIVDSEEDSLTYVSDETDENRLIEAVKNRNAVFGLKRPPKATEIKGEGTSSRKQSAPQRTNWTKNSSKRETATAAGQTNSEPLIHLRSVSSLGRITSRDRERHLALNEAEESRKRRARTAVKSPRRLSQAASAPFVEAGSFRDAAYIRLVLDWERDKYEISQMKVKTYLQNLKI